MLVEVALKQHLLSKSALTDLIGQKLYYQGEVPQDVVEPYVLFFKISTDRAHCYAGSSKLATARFQISIFAEYYYQTKLIAEQIQVALQGVTGNIGDSPYVNIGSSIYLDEVDLYETETKLYHLACDYQIAYTDDH